VFDATFYWSYTGPYEDGVYNFCDGSVFNGVSDAQLQACSLESSDHRRQTAWKAPCPWSGSCPCRAGRLTRATPSRSSTPCSSTQARIRATSMILSCASPGLSACARHPFDLAPGPDRVRSGGRVLQCLGAFRRDASRAGTTKLSVAARHGRVELSRIRVPVRARRSGDDALRQRGRRDHDAYVRRLHRVDDNGSPWYTRGQLLLTNRLTIVP